MPPRPPLNVVGRRLDPDDYRLRDFLTRAAQPHDFYEAGTPEADAVLAEAGAAGAALPVVVDGDTVHAGATIEGLAEAWGVFARPSGTHYDLFIVGAGPAGLARSRVRGLGRALDRCGRGGRAWRPGVATRR